MGVVMMNDDIEIIEENHMLVHQLEYLLLIDGYYKAELANLIGTTIDKIESFMSIPHKASPLERWCQEVHWLYESHHGR